MRRLSLSLVFLSGITLFFLGCKQEDYQKSPNGLQYKIITDEKKPKAKPGEVIEYNIYWRTTKDSVFLNTKDKKIPLTSKVDQPKFQGDPLELLGMLGEGDSASCLVPADMIFRGSPPSFLHHGDMMKLDFKVVKVMSEDDYNKMMAERTKEQLQGESKAIEAYMTKNNLKGEQTPGGMYVVIEEPGTGKQPLKGNTVKVNYTGTLLDGTAFDSSLNPGREPFEFQLGIGQVIRGWDEGIPYFREGGKGKLIIPSAMGYGEQGSGGKIPPNSPLVFDIQLLEVK
jgi:FKBP-type peptidyl-prolyl cis-trans isomerase FkpA